MQQTQHFRGEKKRKIRTLKIRLIFQISEGLLDVFVQLIEVCFDFRFAVFYGVLEFHTAELVQDVAHGIADHVPGDLVLGLSGCFDRVPGHIVQADHVSQHADGFVERAETIVRGITKNERHTCINKYQGIKDSII